MSSPPPRDPRPPRTPDGRFHEPDPGDGDTGPRHVPATSPSVDSGGDTSFLPLGRLPGDTRLYTPVDGGPARGYEPLILTPLPVRRDRNRIVLLGAAIALVAVVIVGAAFWLMRPSPATSSSPSTDPTTSTTLVPPSADPEAQTRLLRLLPAGYSAGLCKPVAPPKDTLAEVDCDKNADSGGPLSATYTLFRDKAALDAVFNAMVQDSSAVICPGNIQSPGPWRGNATSEKVRGVLFCGTQDGRPTVTWTDDAKLLLSAVQSGPQGPTHPQLYAWWSSHS